MLNFGKFNKDIIVYENKNNKIVFQYFETGFTGNPNLRILKITDNLNSKLRKFDEIKLIGYSKVEYINLSTMKANCNVLPETIIYKGLSYKMKSCE